MLLKSNLQELQEQSCKAISDVKKGDFKELSKGLGNILETRQNITAIKEIEVFEDIVNSSEIELKFRREILRIKILTYQHLNYFDALDKNKIISSEAKYIDLFKNLNRIRKSKNSYTAKDTK